MDNTQALVASAQEFLGDEQRVLAAGIFGLQDNYVALFAASATATAVTSGLPQDPMMDAAAFAATNHAARSLNAASKGVSVRMLVVVTDSAIRLLALPAVGSHPEREVMAFARPTTTVDVSRFGASKRVKLTDSASTNEIGLTGSTAFFSTYAAGTKAVLAALARG